jgi:hypothetical protein
MSKNYLDYFILNPEKIRYLFAEFLKKNAKPELNE